MFKTSWGSAKVMRQGAEKAIVQQYIGNYQKTIVSGSKGRMLSEIGTVSEKMKCVAKYVK